MAGQQEPVWVLEILKLIVGAAIPVAVVYVGSRLTRQLQDAKIREDHNFQKALAAQGEQFQQTLWANQKVIEKRLCVYGEAAPVLNELYCYFTWVGRWKEFTPEDVIARKRKLDGIIFVNQFLFPKKFMELYFGFMKACFDHYSGPTSDAKLHTSIVKSHPNNANVLNSSSGADDRRKAYEKRVTGSRWKDEWNDLFVASPEPDREAVIKSRYTDLMQCFARELGVGLEPQRPPSSSASALASP